MFITIDHPNSKTISFNFCPNLSSNTVGFLLFGVIMYVCCLTQMLTNLKMDLLPSFDVSQNTVNAVYIVCVTGRLVPHNVQLPTCVLTVSMTKG